MIDEKEVFKTLGKRIKQVRLLHKLSQAEMGQILGKSASTIYGYENGKIIPPSNVIMEISRLFHISLKDLLGLKESRTDFGILEVYYSALLLNSEAENE